VRCYTGCFLRCRRECNCFRENLRTRFGETILSFLILSLRLSSLFLLLVIALDINATRLALARHNAQIYGVADRIEFIQADYISFARSLASSSVSSSTASTPQQKPRRNIDVVFLSPPWGGPSYLSGSPSGKTADDGNENSPRRSGEGSHPTYSLSSIQPIHGKDLFTLTRKITPNIAYYLPRNSDLSEISGLLTGIDDQGRPVGLPGEQIEVEEEWMGSKLKALTCYFGGIVAGQEGLFC
jgi:trimethylguanosine synthase